jgi:hypothetical protein
MAQTGTTYEQPGGLCNRFAIIIDFNKSDPLYRIDSRGVQLPGLPTFSRRHALQH